MQFLEDIQPLAVFISSVVTIGLLGLILKLTGMLHQVNVGRIEIVKEQKAVVQERLLYAQDQRNELQARLSELQAVLKESGVTMQSLTLDTDPGRDDLQASLQPLLDAIEDIREQMVISARQVAPEQNLQLAQAAMAAGEWVQAGRQFDEYVRVDDDDWEAHYLRGVAYANARMGVASDLSSLRAYDDALALMSDTDGPNMKARVLGYKGALLKRLRRLDEAESVLLLAERLAEHDYERKDIAYNLACVYSMTGRKSEMMRQLSALAGDGQWMSVVGAKPQYFGAFRDDIDFRHLLQSA